MAGSTRDTLDRKTRQIQDDILILGSMVENAIIKSVEALKLQNIDLAKRIYESDQKINQKRFEIENTAIGIIATQQPMAKDLQILASILEVAGELERIGDYAKGIALICLKMNGEAPLKPLIDIPQMAQLTSEMLSSALSAFITGDAESALKIPISDDYVDQLYNQVLRELLLYMASDPQVIDRGNFLLWAAHNLERAADRVTNICERTVYIATGKLEEIKKSDDEFLLLQS